MRSWRTARALFPETRFLGRSGEQKRGRAKDETRVPGLPSFADAKNLQPFIAEYVEGGLNTIVYRDLKGRIRAGYNALVLPQLCDVYLEARRQDLLTKSQQAVAVAAEILTRTSAKLESSHSLMRQLVIRRFATELLCKRF